MSSIKIGGSTKWLPEMERARARAVVLLSSEPRAARDHVYNYANQRGGIGEREEKGRPRRFYCFLNYRFSETEILDWSATCQSVNKIISVPTD